MTAALQASWKTVSAALTFVDDYDDDDDEGLGLHVIAGYPCIIQIVIYYVILKY